MVKVKDEIRNENLCKEMNRFIHLFINSFIESFIESFIHEVIYSFLFLSILLPCPCISINHDSKSLITLPIFLL